MKQSNNFTINNCKIICDEYRVECTDLALTITLQPKFIEVIEYLALNYPRLVSRKELIEEIWNGNIWVGEQALTNAIWKLRQTFRKLLGETPVIDTVHKAGYKLAIEPEFEQVSIKNKDIKKLIPLPFQILLVTLGVIISTNIYLYTNAKTESRNPTITSITTEPGREIFPAPSPDNKWLVFKWIRHGHTDDLYLKNIEHPNHALKRLTFSKAEEGVPIWSKDSRHIYYNRINRQDKNCQVIQLTLENLAEKVIAACQYQKFTQTSISADGKYFAFLAPSKNNRPAPISILDLDNLKKEPHTIYCQYECSYRNRDLAFSPDGKMLAVTRREGDYSENVFLIDLLNNQSSQVTSGFKNIVGIAWYPDNKRIVFGAQESGFREGYVVDITSKKISLLGVPGLAFPVFSNDGESLLYHYRITKRHIASLSIGQNTNSALFPLMLSEFSNRNQSYSKINNKLVYTSNETEHFELWLSDVSGEKREQITFLEQELETPSWSHDGKKIAFLAPNDGNVGNKIYLLDVKTKDVSMLKSPFKTHGSPNWLTNDSAVISSVSVGSKKSLYMFFMDGRQPKVLIENGGVFSQMDNYGNLYFTRENGTIWVKSIENKEQPQQFLAKEIFSTLYLWTLTDGGIYFSKNELEYSQVNYYNFQSKKVTPIARLPKLFDDKYVSFSLVENENKLLITIQELPQANIKLLRNSIIFN